MVFFFKKKKKKGNQCHNNDGPNPLQVATSNAKSQCSVSVPFFFFFDK